MEHGGIAKPKAPRPNWISVRPSIDAASVHQRVSGDVCEPDQPVASLHVIALTRCLRRGQVAASDEPAMAKRNSPVKSAEKVRRILSMLTDASRPPTKLCRSSTLPTKETHLLPKMSSHRPQRRAPACRRSGCVVDTAASTESEAHGRAGRKAHHCFGFDFNRGKPQK